MKLLSSLERKQVKYFGINLIVPSWVVFIATDQDGSVVGFLCKPECREDLEIWVSHGTAIEICAVDLEGLDWKETLKTIVE